MKVAVRRDTALHPVSREVRHMIAAIVASWVTLLGLFVLGHQLLTSSDEREVGYYVRGEGLADRIYLTLQGVRLPGGTQVADAIQDPLAFTAEAQRGYIDAIAAADEIAALHRKFEPDARSDKMMARLARAVAELRALHSRYEFDRDGFARAFATTDTYLEIVAQQLQRHFDAGRDSLIGYRRNVLAVLATLGGLVLALLGFGTWRYVRRSLGAIDVLLHADARQRVEIATSRDALAAAQSIAHVGSWESDEPGGETIWSREMYNILEADQEPAPALDRFLANVHAEDRERVRTAIEGAAEYNIVWRLDLPDGRLKHVRGLGKTLVDGARTVRLGTVQDITESWKNQMALESALREKEILLKEVYHRVKNNLQVVSGLLNLQGREIKDAEVLRLFEESANRVRSMALVHELLYRSRDLGRINCGEFLGELAARLSDAYGPTARSIRIEARADKDLELGLDSAIPCALMVNELVANAYRHGFEPGAPGTIRTEIAYWDTSRALLVVEDNGKGFPRGFRPEASPTLGMRIVTTLARQLGGDLRFESRRGVRVEFTFPRGIRAEGGA